MSKPGLSRGFARPIAVGCLGSLITLALFVGGASAVVWAIRWLT